MDSETETEFTEITLSPQKQEDSSVTKPSSATEKLFTKRTSNNFHNHSFASLTRETIGILPHSSMQQRSMPYGQSWEAYNLMEEMIHGSHVHKSTSDSQVHSDYTMELDSLSARYNQTQSLIEKEFDGETIEEEEEELDSLNFNLQEVDEDSLTQDYDYEHDSLQIPEPKVKDNKKKLIIPYNESFSSTNSIFTTSQDGSLDSCTKQQTEEDSLTQSNPNLTLNMAPIKPWLNELTSQQQQQQQHHTVNINPPINYLHPTQPLIINSDYPKSKTVNPSPIETTSRPDQSVQPSTSPSLMKLATERMKRKFLGWN